ncbi:protein kinase domain-containing protein [Microbispora sp. CA-102843]|uniref:protein kinase domain-containing protein n=1 Tax=Microbispora sp. CA-102843 TaxID=3239952 RepID=UPI003D914D72
MPTASALLPGDPPRLGDFWLAGRLGAGGQGVVYEAYDAEGTRVAVKVLHGDAAGDPELRERFGKEAAAARRVASFCTARVLAVELDAPKPYIASEYVEGPSLRRAVTEGRRFAGDELHRLATAVATALAAVHGAGVIHRDLKPDNVLLGPDGPRVIDFGIARTLEMSLTTTGLVTGTPTYMAPEVFTGQRAGAPADVFCWGAVVLFAASGDDPFRAETLGAVMHRVLSTDPDLGVLPGSLRPLVEAALAKEPSARPTAKELLLGLVNGFHGSDADLLRAGSAEAEPLGRDVAASWAADPALGTLAEDAYGLLGTGERELVPDLLLRMVSAGDGGEITARPLPREEVFAGRTHEEEAGLRRVLEVFGYLLIGRGDDIVLTRPALVQAWPRLRAWVDDERAGLPVHDSIRTAARHWHEHGRREGEVFQGSRLDTALRWAATGRRHIVLNPLERDFLDACTAAVRRRVRRRRLVTVLLAVLLVLTLVAGALAVRQSMVVSAQRDQAVAAQAAATADTLRTTDPAGAMLLSAAAWRVSPTTGTRSVLTSSWAGRERTAFADSEGSGETIRLLSPDGRRLVSVDSGGVRIHDLRTGKRVGGWADLRLGQERVLSASLGPSGRRLVVESTGALRVWDLTTGAVVASRGIRPDLRRENMVVLGAGDRYVVVYEGPGNTIWDTRTGRVIEPPTFMNDRSFSPAGDRVAVATSRHRFQLLRLPEATPIRDWHERGACTGTAMAVAFSPDGRRLACGTKNMITLIDAASGRKLWYADGDGTRLWFSPDGRYLATGADTLGLIRVRDGAPLLTFRAAADAVAFDGSLLRYLVDDTVVGLDVSDLDSPVRLPGSAPSAAAFSPDGRLLATRTGPTVTLWDAARRTRAGDPLPTTGGDFAPAFSGDGRLVAAIDGTVNQLVRVWDTATHAEMAKVTLPGKWYAMSVALSGDGRLLAISAETGRRETGGNGRVLVWDLRGNRAFRTITLDDAFDVVFRPGGRMLLPVEASANRLIDVLTGEPGGPPLGTGGAHAALAELAFSPDGRTLATGDISGRLAFWDVATGRRNGPLLQAQAGPFAQIVFSPRGDVAASIGLDRTLQLWQVATPRKLGQAVTGGEGEYLAAGFTADGSVLRTLDGQGSLREVPVDPGRVIRDLCARAGRTLTEAEWRTYLPDVAYRDPCPRS